MVMLRRALAAWKDAIGEAHVVTDPPDLASAETATFLTTGRVLALLRPGRAAELAACLAIAHRHEVAVHPISRGMNWGFGSRVPPGAWAVLVDLQRMDAILRFDEDRACVTLEPGVTFRQLDLFLRGRGSRCFLPAIGGSGDASVVGNAIERGHGIGPNPRRADAIGSMKALLADGRAVSSGFCADSVFAGGEAHRHGGGPCGGGLFLQSNLAVVTEMTLALERRPALLTPFRGGVADTAALGALLDALRPMLLDAALGRHLLVLWNRYKYLACRSRYPWPAMEDGTPLDLGRIGQAGDWLVSGALYSATDGHRQAASEALRSLRPLLTGLDILDPDAPEAVRAAPGFLGVPQDANLRSMYWRARTEPAGPIRPERDGCGVIQICPLLPMGREIVPVIDMIEAEILGFGFEPQIGFDCSDPRTVEAFVTISFDRGVARDDGAAIDCCSRILHRLERSGCPSYRTGVQSAGRPVPGGEGNRLLYGLLKTALDPRLIIMRDRFGA